MNPWLSAMNLLVVRLDNIGDVVMLGPALRAIKETAPHVRLTLLASPAGATAAPLLPWVDDLITWRALWQDLGHLPFDPAREWELIAQLTSYHFDGALIFTSFSQTPHTPAYVCYLAGIPLRAGESKEFGGSVLTTTLTPAPDDLHQVERNLRLVETLGFAGRERGLALAIPESARLRAAQLLADAGVDPRAPFILLHPGASAPARRYPAERSGALADLLSRHGWPVLVTGVERERELQLAVLQHAPLAHNLNGKTSLAEFAALVEHAALVICGNTLPLHLADAMNTPVISLYSGTDYEEQWRPRQTVYRLLRQKTACAPCYLLSCPIGQPCLAIEPQEVAAVVEELLSQAGDTT